MNKHFLFVGLLFFALTCGLLVCLTQIRSNEFYWPNPWAIGGIAILLAQVGLISAWTIFGSQNLALRVGAMVVAQSVAGKLAAVCADGQTQSWSLAIGVYAVVLIGVFIALRWFRIRIVPSIDHNVHPRAKVAEPEHQYSLLQMFSLITSASLLFAFWTRPDLPWQIAIRASLFFGFLSLIAAASFWSGMRHRVAFNCMLTIFGSLVAGIWFQVLDFAGLERASLIALALVLQLLMVTSAVILRVFGFKLAPIPKV